jgi:hypothetical protein
MVSKTLFLKVTISFGVYAAIYISAYVPPLPSSE